MLKATIAHDYNSGYISHQAVSSVCVCVHVCVHSFACIVFVSLVYVDAYLELEAKWRWKPCRAFIV